MSVVLQIEPVETVTQNGTPARVTGIDMTSGDPLHGVVEHEPGAFRRARWQTSGSMRDAPQQWDLDMSRPELAAIAAVAKALGAKGA